MCAKHARPGKAIIFFGANRAYAHKPKASTNFLVTRRQGACCRGERSVSTLGAMPARPTLGGPRNPYVVLGARVEDDDKAIRRRYLQKSREMHPDKGGDAASFREVADAFELLSDPARRRRFDSLRQFVRPERHRQRTDAADWRAARTNAAAAPESEISSEDLRECAFYVALFVVYIVTALAGVLLLAGKLSLSERLRIVGNINAVVAMLPAVAWARSSPSEREPEASRWSALWARFLQAQVLGSVSGMVAVGALWIVAWGLRALFAVVGSEDRGFLMRTFTKADGTQMQCLLTLCVPTRDTTGAEP